jgi:ATP-dependent DNA ligase
MRLYSRPGNDFTRQFPLIVEALERLCSRSCIIDGEAVACDDNGVSSFDLIRDHRANGSVFLYAFDLIELDGDDLRRDPLESAYRSGRSPDWLKIKNPDCSAVKREAEEDGAKTGGDEEAPYQRPHPARRIYRKIARIGGRYSGFHSATACQ